MNIALHLRRELLNYKDCIEACKCHPKRWTCWNIDVCRNIKTKAVLCTIPKCVIWLSTCEPKLKYCAFALWRMTDSSPIYKEMEFHIIRSSFIMLLLGFPFLFVGMFFFFSLFSFANLQFPFYLVLFYFIFSFFCSSFCFFFSTFFLLSRSFLSIFLFSLSVLFLSCFASFSFLSSSELAVFLYSPLPRYELPRLLVVFL